MTSAIRYSAGVALAVGALALGGCGGDDGEVAAAPSSNNSGIVSIETVDGTKVLADSQGRTLYSAEVEHGGKVLCVDACTSFWSPLLSSPDEAQKAAGDLSVDLTVLKRPDGMQQLTFDGLPLYTFTQEGAGTLDGDGFVDDFDGTHFEWQAARPEGGAAPSNQDQGGGGYGY
jgi:predicted lipoprotein with Yx(FWY)xxD motif